MTMSEGLSRRDLLPAARLPGLDSPGRPRRELTPQEQKLQIMAEEVGGPGTRVKDANTFTQFLVSSAEEYESLTEERRITAGAAKIRHLVDLDHSDIVAAMIGGAQEHRGERPTGVHDLYMQDSLEETVANEQALMIEKAIKANDPVEQEKTRQNVIRWLTLYHGTQAAVAATMWGASAAPLIGAPGSAAAYAGEGILWGGADLANIIAGQRVPQDWPWPARAAGHIGIGAAGAFGAAAATLSGRRLMRSLAKSAVGKALIRFVVGPAGKWQTTQKDFASFITKLPTSVQIEIEDALTLAAARPSPKQIRDISKFKPGSGEWFSAADLDSAARAKRQDAADLAAKEKAGAVLREFDPPSGLEDLPPHIESAMSAESRRIGQLPEGWKENVYLIPGVYPKLTEKKFYSLKDINSFIQKDPRNKDIELVWVGTGRRKHYGIRHGSRHESWLRLEWSGGETQAWPDRNTFSRKVNEFTPFEYWDDLAAKRSANEAGLGGYYAPRQAGKPLSRVGEPPLVRDPIVEPQPVVQKDVPVDEVARFDELGRPLTKEVLPGEQLPLTAIRADDEVVRFPTADDLDLIKGDGQAYYPKNNLGGADIGQSPIHKVVIDGEDRFITWLHYEDLGKNWFEYKGQAAITRMLNDPQGGQYGTLIYSKKDMVAKLKAEADAAKAAPDAPTAVARTVYTEIPTFRKLKDWTPIAPEDVKLTSSTHRIETDNFEATYSYRKKDEVEQTGWYVRLKIDHAGESVADWPTRFPVGETYIFAPTKTELLPYLRRAESEFVAEQAKFASRPGEVKRLLAAQERSKERAAADIAAARVDEVPADTTRTLDSDAVVPRAEEGVDAAPAAARIPTEVTDEQARVLGPSIFEALPRARVATAQGAGLPPGMSAIEAERLGVQHRPPIRPETGYYVESGQAAPLIGGDPEAFYRGEGIRHTLRPGTSSIPGIPVSELGAGTKTGRPLSTSEIHAMAEREALAAGRAPQPVQWFSSKRGLGDIDQRVLEEGRPITFEERELYLPRVSSLEQAEKLKLPSYSVGEERVPRIFRSPVAQELARLRQLPRTGMAVTDEFYEEHSRPLVEELGRAVKGITLSKKELAAIRAKERAQKTVKYEKLLEELSGQGLPQSEVMKRARAAFKGEYTVREILLNEGVDMETLGQRFHEVLALTRPSVTGTQTNWRAFNEVASSEALSKIFEKGVLPNDSEIKLLSRVFGPQFAEIMGKEARALGGSTWHTFVEVMNIPKTLRSSFDLSAPFRQGFFLSARHPIMATKRVGAMIQDFFSEEKALQHFAELRTRENFQRFTSNPNSGESRIFIHDITGDLGLHAREEAFLSTWASRLPGVKMSERAFGGYLNGLRMDVMESWVKGAQDAGITYSDEMIDNAAKFINAASGRGRIPSQFGPEIAAGLNAVFWSPRLVVSRIQMFTDPASLTKAVLQGDKQARFLLKQQMSTLAAGLGLSTTILTMMHVSGLAKVNVNPLSSDFGKGNIMGTRFDFWAGLQPLARYFWQFVRGRRSPVSGLQAGETVPVPRWNIMVQFLRSKLAPGIPVLAANELFERTFIGEKFTTPIDPHLRHTGYYDPTITKPAATPFLGSSRDIDQHSRLPIGDEGKLPHIFGWYPNPVVDVRTREMLGQIMPLAQLDLLDAVDEHGMGPGMFMGLAATLGIGVQTYGSEETGTPAR